MKMHSMFLHRIFAFFGIYNFGIVYIFNLMALRSICVPQLHPCVAPLFPIFAILLKIYVCAFSERKGSFFVH